MSWLSKAIEKAASSAASKLIKTLFADSWKEEKIASIARKYGRDLTNPEGKDAAYWYGRGSKDTAQYALDSAKDLFD